MKGTLKYRAPELFWKRGDYWYVDLFAADMWAVGVTLYWVLTGKYPF